MDDINLNRATRKLLFGKAKQEIPGDGRSAAETPARHVRVKVTMNLDSDIIEHFKLKAETESGAYQFLINQALREYIEGSRPERLTQEIGEILLNSKSFLRAVADSLESGDLDQPSPEVSFPRLKKRKSV